MYANTNTPQSNAWLLAHHTGGLECDVYTLWSRLHLRALQQADSSITDIDLEMVEKQLGKLTFT
jgi:hypothetical protein